MLDSFENPRLPPWAECEGMSGRTPSNLLTKNLAGAHLARQLATLGPRFVPFL